MYTTDANLSEKKDRVLKTYMHGYTFNETFIYMLHVVSNLWLALEWYTHTLWLTLNYGPFTCLMVWA